LQAAHDALKDENKRLTELLRGDRMIVATRINHEYTKAKGVIRELQAENEQLRAILENTRQQRDDAYQERAEAQRWQPVAGEQTFPLRYGELIVEDNGAYIAIDGGEALGEMHAWLPENVRMCRKVQP
jgi:hypothetical protein